MRRPYSVVDVFAEQQYRGNPLAVVLDGEGLTTEEMQGFARWTNLSETTFVLPATGAGADYRVRIFTPMSELPFAGHPTLGTCHAWLSRFRDIGSRARQDGVFVQECDAGLIPIRRNAGRLAFLAPPLVRSGPVEEQLVSHIAALLGIGSGEIQAAQWVDNGPGWVAVLLANADAVLALRPRTVDLFVGVVGPHPDGAPEDFEVRAFFPKDGATAEDPVTGSLNASLAEWLIGTGVAKAPYVVSQGKALGRAGKVYVECDDDGRIWVGGGTITCVTGEVDL